MSNTFRGRTLTDARKAAEAELGPNLVVLAQRRVKRKGIAGIVGSTEFEITAGVAAPSDEKVDLEKDVKVEIARAARKMLFAPGAYDETTTSRGSELDRLQREVRAMRAMLHSMRSSPTGLQSELQGLRRAVDEIVPTSAPAHLEMLLNKSGIDSSLAGDIRRELRQHPAAVKGDNAGLVDAYRDALADRIAVRSWPLSSDGRSVVAVVGPPGVGKTTTAAKLAAHAISEDKTVAIVACDTFRVGAVEQITRYATLLEVPITVAKTQRALHRAIADSDADVVIVDTSGRGPQSDGCVEAGLGNPSGWADRARHVLLCIDANTRSADAERIAKRYEACAPTSLSVTKIDQTSAPCGLIVGSAVTELAVSVLCSGQRVPEDIAPATAGRILEHLAPHRRLRN